MGAYCECGAPAEIFTDDQGNSLPDPMCTECWNFMMAMAELYAPELLAETEKESP